MAPKGPALAEEVPRKAWGWERSFPGQAPSPDLTSSARAKHALAPTLCPAWHIISLSPPRASESASVAFPIHKEGDKSQKVNCSDLEPPLGSGIAGFDSRSFPCHDPAHSPAASPPWAALCLFAGSHPRPQVALVSPFQ